MTEKLPVQVITRQEKLLPTLLIQLHVSGNQLSDLGLELSKNFQTSYLLAFVAQRIGFGANLRRLCEEENLQANELAARVKVKPPTMSRWMAMAAPPAAATVVKLAVALNRTVDDLIAGIYPDYDKVVIARDLTRQIGDQKSNLNPVAERGSDVPASGGVEGGVLERVARLEAELAATRDVANRLARLLEQSGVPAKDRPVTKHQAGVRRGNRKTG